MYIYRIIYRCTMTYVTWLELRDKPFFPPSLGGSGDLSKWMEGLPAWSKTRTFDIIFVSSAGFFLEDLVELAVRKKQKDFIEMSLHHFISIVLIYFSHVINCGSIGQMIVYLHYIADIFVAAGKCFNELPGIVVPASMLIMTLLSWGWTRLIVFPQIIYSCIFFDPENSNLGIKNPLISKYAFIFFLLVLQVLHWFWYI